MITTLRYCEKCFQYLVPNNIPPSHKSHAKDFNAMQNYCFTCRQSIVDGVSNVHHEAHLEREIKQRIVKKQPPTTKILDKGNFIPLGVGTRLEQEAIVKKIAQRRNTK